MEKKNTMLLTVIAVATLLVAVVGATFAYFSLQVGGETTNTTATVNTGKIGLFTYSKETEKLTLNIAASLMAEELVSDNAIDYFADPTNPTLGTPKTLAKGLTGDTAPDDTYFASIGKLTLSNADAGTKYHCQGKFTITTTFEDADGVEPGDASTVKTQIQDEDGRLYLKTSSSAVTVNIADDQGGSPAEEGVDSTSHTLKSLVNDAGAKTFWVTYDFTSTGSDMSAELKAALKVSNTKAAQNYLAAKKITVKITSDTVTCNIVAS